MNRKAAVAGVVAGIVVAVVGFIVVVRSDGVAARISAGSAVTGTGWLIEGLDGQVQLCLGGFGRLEAVPGCSVVAVPVDGVQWDAVPGATQGDGIWYAEHVTLRGTWTGSTVVVQSVVAAPQASDAPPVPDSCIGQAGASGSPEKPEDEAALRPLDEEVLGNPDRYAGLWRAASTEGMGPIVVEVVGDLSAAESKLRRLYAYPLCVVAAKFSENDLNTAFRELGPATQDWFAEVDYPRNRVVVSVAVLTDAVERRLKPYLELVFVSQLLQPA